MNTALETAKETVLTPLTNAPLLVAVAVGLLALSWLLTKWPKFPNQWIPVTVAIVAAVLGYFVVPMQGPADWAFQVADPDVADVIRRVAVGLAVGVAVNFARKPMLKRLSKWSGNDDTSSIPKPPEGK